MWRKYLAVILVTGVFIEEAISQQCYFQPNCVTGSEIETPSNIPTQADCCTSTNDGQSYADSSGNCIAPQCVEDGFCESEEEDTEHGTFIWNQTPVGETDEQVCEYGNDKGFIEGSKATRYCATEGWMMYNGNACLPEATHILIQFTMKNVTAENAAELVEGLASTLGDTIEQVQTKDNLDRVTSVLEDVVGLLDLGNFTVDESFAENTVGLLDSISDWPSNILEEQPAILVVLFKTIALNLMDRDDFEKLEIVGDDITMVAERHSTQVIRSTGLMFNPNTVTAKDIKSSLNSSDVKTNASLNAITIPARTFENITSNSTGVLFILYADNTLFPIRLNQTESDTTYKAIGSAILSATLAGHNIEGSINITLSITITNWSNPVCVSYNFSEAGGNWSTKGCTLISVDNDNEVVVCGCSQLTNFGILVDVNARKSPPKHNKPLRAFSIVGSVLSMFGLIITIFTLLAFKKIRQKDFSKLHVQLCIAIFCMVLFFLIGIDRTENEIACTICSLVIQYFTMAVVAWVGAEAVLMFWKLIIVFGHFNLLLVSSITWAVPALFLIVGLATLGTGNNLLISENFCFISEKRLFYGVFLAPILVIFIINTVLLVLVFRVLIQHSCRKVADMDKRTKAQQIFKTFISIVSISLTFRLQWLFGAFTITDTSVLYQWLFVVFTTLQGFLLFFFFCILRNDAREEWLNVLSCGNRKKKKHGMSTSVAIHSFQRRHKTDSVYITSKNIHTQTLQRNVVSSVGENSFVELSSREEMKSTPFAMPTSISEDKETVFVIEEDLGELSKEQTYENY